MPFLASQNLVLYHGLPGIKVILGFPFIQKARVTFRHPRDKDRPVFTLLCDPRTRQITSVKTNTETERVRDSFLCNHQTRVIQTDSGDDGYTADSGSV